jgi:pimeloyl-ACP methyl ester carboxylesterase
MLVLPEGASGIVIFAGADSGKLGNALVQAGIGTFLFTPQETDVEPLARRLQDASAWLERQEETRGLYVGYLGGRIGASAALVAAGRLGDGVDAVVSCDGRPDLAGPLLGKVMAATLLIVDEREPELVALNEKAYAQLRCTKALRVAPFDEAVDLAVEWFRRFLTDDPLEALRTDE